MTDLLGYLAHDLEVTIKGALGAAVGPAVAENAGWRSVVRGVAADLATAFADDVLAVAASIGDDADSGIVP